MILAQMEVYEKSLKSAQRGLLRKAEWGDAITPQPEVQPTGGFLQSAILAIECVQKSKSETVKRSHSLLTQIYSRSS